MLKKKFRKAVNTANNNNNVEKIGRREERRFFFLNNNDFYNLGTALTQTLTEIILCL